MRVVTRTATLILSALLALSSCNPEIRNAKALAGRIMGDKASGIVFEQISSDKDSYEIESVGGKVHIRGNNANSMAVGLNRYLQEYCLSNVSWYDYNPVELPQTLPAVEGKVSADANVDYRFFLNYCTYGYTMPWWGWKEWERFIDWMALNGVNMPLAITGQEAVWQKVYRNHGMSDEQIRKFFTGPAHLPWQRMCNLDYWQGPLPQGWIDAQAKLQKKILKRERALNMTPVLPAFAGHIPAELAEGKTEKVDTFRVSYWGGFANEYRCTFLSPMDPLYSDIQREFMEEQTRLYGTDHIYGVDPFNEVDAPFWDPETLAKISSGIYKSMTDVDPDAIWLQMGWLFYADEGHWTDENIKAYLTAVPRGKMIILDYYCDHTQVWERTESFYGQDFIWCYLGNFGGMTGIEGDFHQNSDWLAQTAAQAGPGFVGIGSTLEGFGVNEPVYEHVLSKAWNTGISDEEYIDNIADRHLGRKDDDFRRFWHIIADRISVTHSKTASASVVNAHPSLEHRWHWTTEIKRGYDIAELEKALELLEGVEGASNYLAYDKTNVRRQVIANRAEAIRDAFTAAYRASDRAGMLKHRQAFLDLCDELTAVLRTRREFSLDDWIESAKSWAVSPEEEAYYEMNARSLISVWGDSFHLCDYANRDWDGLVDTYYKVRWERFFDAVIAAFDAGEPFVNSKSTGYVGTSSSGSAEGVGGRALEYDHDIWNFECQWAHVLPSVTSPDGKLKLVVSTVDGQLHYSVERGSEILVKASPMGFELSDGRILGSDTEILSTETSSESSSWETVWGEDRIIEDNHNTLLVHCTDMDVEFRVFNDGLGFRYIFPDSLGDFTIKEETTEFRFARGDHKIWWMPRSEPYYEAYGSHTAFSEIDCAYTPVTITGADGLFYSIHEAALLDFAKMNLLSEDNFTLKASLTKAADGSAVKVSATRHSPWRTLLITEKAGELIESRVMLNLNEPCKLEDTSWIKPGKYIGIWWILHKYQYTWYYDPLNPEGHGATTERTKRYIDFAAANNIQGVLVEGWNLGWNGDWMKNSDKFSFTEAYPDYDFDAIMEYARSKGVQMIIHNETGANTVNYFNQIPQAYAKYRDAGMHYIKTGNVNLLMDGIEEHDSQYGVNRLHEIVEKAALYQICVDEHEPCIPTGVCRTWPNLMTGEAIRGQEHDAWEQDGGNKPEHQTVAPFLRGLAGPMDYTFGTFDFSNPVSPFSRVRTTIAKQLAQYVVIYSPLQMASDDPYAYEGVKAFDFIRDVPTDWEKTKVLDAVIGDYIVTARQERNGSDWYLGAITDENSRTLEVPLSFLGKGTWTAQIYADGSDADFETNPISVEYSEKKVKATDVLTLRLATSGGCAIRFKKI